MTSSRFVRGGVGRSTLPHPLPASRPTPFIGSSFDGGPLRKTTSTSSLCSDDSLVHLATKQKSKIDQRTRNLALDLLTSALRPSGHASRSASRASASVAGSGENPLVGGKTASPLKPRSSSPVIARASTVAFQGNYASEVENSTIHKQRRELQALIQELKDRDRELNVMVAQHQKQMAAWDEDRQKLLSLEHKCGRQEGELNTMTQKVTSLTVHVRSLEHETSSLRAGLDSAHAQCKTLTADNGDAYSRIDHLQSQNGGLTAAVKEHTMTIGTLEGKEQEHLTLIRIKDQELLQASNTITEMSAKLKKSDLVLKESRKQENELHKTCCEWRSKAGETKRDLQKLQNEYAALTEGHQSICDALDKCKEQLLTINRDYECSLEREKRKDQLLDLQKSKQERAETELGSLKSTYERTQKELAVLQVNLETAREVLAKEDRVAKGLLTPGGGNSGRSTPIGGGSRTRNNSFYAPLGGGRGGGGGGGGGGGVVSGGALSAAATPRGSSWNVAEEAPSRPMSAATSRKNLTTNLDDAMIGPTSTAASRRSSVAAGALGKDKFGGSTSSINKCPICKPKENCNNPLLDLST